MTHLYANKYFGRFLLYFFKITGLFTTQLTVVASKKNKTCHCITRKSKIGILYNVFLIFFLCMTGIPGTLYVIQTKYDGRFKEEAALPATFDVSAMLCTSYILLKFCNQQEQITSIMNKLTHIIHLSMVLDEKKFLSNSSVDVKAAIYCVVNLIVLLAGLARFYRKNIFIFLYLISKLPVRLVCIGVFVQYSIALEYLRIIFMLINDNFRELSKPPKCEIYNIWDQEIKRPIRIDRLIRLYRLLSEISDELSKFYSFPVMWCILNIFFNSFRNCYINVKQIIVFKTFPKNLELPSMYMNVFPLIILIFSASNTVKEVILESIVLNS